MNPHLPYNASPEHREHFDEDDYGEQPGLLPKRAQNLIGRHRIPDTEDLRVYRARYDASIHEADEMLGTVVAELDKLDLLAGTLIIVTSDHGEEYLGHGGMSHGSKPYGELLRVPLLFHYPTALARGKRVSGSTSILDIYSTLVDLFGFKTDQVLQGVSLLPSLLPGKKMVSPDRDFVTTHTPMSRSSKGRSDVIVSGGLKLIVNRDNSGEETVELYDLAEDADVAVEWVEMEDCILEQGDDYKFSGRVKVPSAQAASGSSYLFWYWYDGPSCSGIQSTQASSQWVSSSDDWIEISTPLIEAPAGTVSAWLILSNLKISPGPGTFQSYFDGLVFNGASLFSDGFESGSLSMWSGSSP